jgi:DNA primase
MTPKNKRSPSGGFDLSPNQEELLVRSGVRFLTLLLDGDVPGRQATKELLLRLGKCLFVRAAALPDGEAPDTVSEALLAEVLRVP